MSWEEVLVYGSCSIGHPHVKNISSNQGIGLWVCLVLYTSTIYSGSLTVLPICPLPDTPMPARAAMPVEGNVVVGSGMMMRGESLYSVDQSFLLVAIFIKPFPASASCKISLARLPLRMHSRMAIALS
jgi:hypothetical protein